jgi:hypothetical protein
MNYVRSAILILILSALSSCCSTPTPPKDGNAGSFDSNVRTEWQSDGRKMALLRPLVFTDVQQQAVWTAPTGALIDGASIPQFFWSEIGGPYEGLYRDASVTHDFECCVKLRPWREVHLMFYYGMIANGVDKSLALWMYWAVYHFGPRWHLAGESAAMAAEVDATRESMTEREARAAKALFESTAGLSPSDVEQLDAARLRARLALLNQSADVSHGPNDNRLIPFADKVPPCVQ